MLAERAEAAEKIPRPLRGVWRRKDDARLWIRTHRAHAIVGAIVAVGVLVAGYQLLIVRPAAERDRIALATQSAERLKTQTASRQTTVDACLAKAQEDAAAAWAKACRARKERNGCALPARVIQEQKQQETAARNSCLMIGF